MIDFEKIEEDHEDEFLKFDGIKPERRLCERPDLNAFLLLHKLVPGTDDIVGDAQHDEIFLSVDIDELNEVASEDDALDLIRCGVRSGEYGLCMFT